MNICEPFRQTAGDIAKICDANFHHRLVLNIGEAIPWYLCMFLSFSCEWRSSVVQARMCKLGRDPLIFLKILVVIGHVCIYWSKVAEGFSVFNAVLFFMILSLSQWEKTLLHVKSSLIGKDLAQPLGLNQRYKTDPGMIFILIAH